MDYDKMTIKSLANDCFEDSFYKINAADLESKIEHLCIKYHQDKLDNLSQHLVSKCLPPWVRPTITILGMLGITVWLIFGVC